MVRIAITADIHLGHSDHLGRINPSSGLHTRLEDFLRNFDRVVEFVLDSQNKIDAFIIAGDLYKTRHPTNIQQEEFGKRLSRLSDAGRWTYILMGNHDILVSENASHTGGLIKALNPSHIKVIDSPQNISQDGITMGFMPYIYRQKLGLKTNEEALGYYRKEVNRLSAEGATILVGHQSVEGAHMPAGYLDPEAMSEIVVPRAAFSAFDFCVFGHIHEHQILSRKPLIVYPGPIERIDFSQADLPCGFLVFDTEDKTCKFVTLPAVDLYKIEVDLTDGQGDLTKRVTQAIDINRLPDSIVQLKVWIRDTDIVKLNKTEIQTILDMARFNAGFKTEIKRERVGRDSEINESISVLDALQRYIKGRDDLKDIAEDLVKTGVDIIKLCDLNRD